jgi:hypothetical protein
MDTFPTDDVRAIERLKYRYLRALDTRDWGTFEDCFVPEATGDYNGLVFDDRASLVAYMRKNMPVGLISMHQAHHPEIDLDPADPDRATAHWYLHDKIIVDSVRFALEGGAIYSDEYVRTDAGWRILRTGYRRTFEMTWNLDDPGSVKVTGPNPPFSDWPNT